MSRPTVNDVHTNRPLSNILIAYLQGAAGFAAQAACPGIPVMKQSDTYIIYTKDYFRRVLMRKRAPATESAGGDFVATTGSYKCEKYGLHYDLPDEVRANQDSPINLDVDAVAWLGAQALLKQEADFATEFWATSKWGTDVQGGTDITRWDQSS